MQHIFAKYCEPRPLDESMGSPTRSTAAQLLTPPEGAYLSDAGLDTWYVAASSTSCIPSPKAYDFHRATDTNGAPFAQETKDELIEFMDVTEQGGLTFKGFLQIYQLQTENDEEETWRDLVSLPVGLWRKLGADPATM